MSITDVYQSLFGRNGTNKGTDIDMAEHGRAGGVSTGQPFKFTDAVPMAMKMVTSGSNYFIGVANPGSVTTDAVWQAMKLDTTTGIAISWADGNTKFDNKADDLANLNYS